MRIVAFATAEDYPEARHRLWTGVHGIRDWHSWLGAGWKPALPGGFEGTLLAMTCRLEAGAPRCFEGTLLAMTRRLGAGAPGLGSGAPRLIESALPC